MKVVVFLLAVFGARVIIADDDPPQYADRECGTDLNNLWIDVVAVVDNSIGMTNDGLTSVAANLASVFSSGTRIGTNPKEPRTTRLGLVTYNAGATLNADLNKFQSLDDIYDNVFNDLSRVSSSDESNLEAGLALAENLLATQSTGTSRDHYKKVVVVYASAYNGDSPVPISWRLRSSGVVIITVAFVQLGDDTLLWQLANIASPGYNFTNVDDEGNLIGKIQEAFLETNCFCPNHWIQYQYNISDTTSYKYGICIEAIGMSAVWRAAKMSCANRWKNSYLATEFNQQKHDFIVDSIKTSITGFSQPYTYHIGLNMVKGKWVWDQPSGLAPLELQDWTNWVDGYPMSSSTQTAVLNMQINETVLTQWQNTDALKTSANYFCETAACDTDNYCTSAVNDN
ncbi:hypothetical protein CAEBREN_20112 [Caenorhabditis brenneri]|uniref:Uncharacterized protein n=1 Tax=Caenorhabditis brenneri TaxID=135651 RepID=G0NIH5_CAEBE|nr:hypothetical protein CAEBREN_20112 [Caenorhabditis brenneri]